MYSLQTASFSLAVTVYLVSQFNLQKFAESAFSLRGLMLVDQLYLIPGAVQVIILFHVQSWLLFPMDSSC